MSSLNVTVRALGATAFAVVLAAVAAISSAGAQQSLRVAGTIESVDGPVLSIKSDKLGVVKVELTGDAAVFGVAKGTLADLTAGAYIGAGWATAIVLGTGPTAP